MTLVHVSLDAVSVMVYVSCDSRMRVIGLVHIRNMRYLHVLQNYRSLLQHIVSFVGHFCKRDV